MEIIPSPIRFRLPKTANSARAPLIIMRKNSIIAALLAMVPCLASAASFSFDGAIERSDPDDWGGFVTLDRLDLQINSAGLLTLVGQELSLQGLSFGLYSSHPVDGGLVLDFVPLEYSVLPNGTTQVEGTVAAGAYYVVITSGVSEWDGQDGLQNYAHADGGPGVGYGSYHLDLTGDFSVSSVHEGQLPSAAIPEPAGFSLTVSLLVAAVVCRRTSRAQSDDGASVGYIPD